MSSCPRKSGKPLKRPSLGQRLKEFKVGVNGLSEKELHSEGIPATPDRVYREAFNAIGGWNGFLGKSDYNSR